MSSLWLDRAQSGLGLPSKTLGPVEHVLMGGSSILLLLDVYSTTFSVLYYPSNKQ